MNAGCVRGRGPRAALSLVLATAVALVATLALGTATASAGVYLGSVGAPGEPAPAGKSAFAPARERAGRIVGGSETTIADYPWQVAIAANDAIYVGNGFDRQFCGGTAIAPTLIVTAAHCTVDIFDDPPDGFFDEPVNFAAISGRTTLSSTVGQETPVADIYAFFSDNGTPDPSDDLPLYDPVTNEWDVVVMRLVSSSLATPVMIAGPSETALWSPGSAAFVSGWGSTFEGGPQSDTLKQAQIEMLSDVTCDGVYDGGITAQGLQFLPDVMACAGALAGGTDTCQGDSGGPLVVAAPAGEFRLVGDTSFGLGCARAGFPGVYGRVADEPIRSAIGDLAQSLTGIDVIGPASPPPPPPPPESDPGDDAGDRACAKAKRKLGKAKRKVRKAKRKLAKVRDDGSKKQVKRAKKKLKKAKSKKKKAKKKVRKAC